MLVPNRVEMRSDLRAGPNGGDPGLRRGDATGVGLGPLIAACVLAGGAGAPSTLIFRIEQATFARIADISSRSIQC